jgi:dienelactone hydrolase
MRSPNILTRALRPAALLLALGLSAAEPSPAVFPGTAPLTQTGDLAHALVGGIDRYLDRVLEAAPAARARHWNRDLSSPEAYVRSIETNRQHLARILGVVDRRAPALLKVSAPVSAPPSGNPAEVGRGRGFRVLSVTWPVVRGVEAEGLMLVPEGEAKASVVAIADADQTPEQIAGLQPGLSDSDQFARRLAERGCRVLIPALVDRSDTHSGLPGVRKLKQSQREVLWRAAYEMGRTVQGYEIQKVLAAVDWLESQKPASGARMPVGVIGYGEGGLIACFAGALDPRIEATAVSGYHVNPRLHDEPIYRNVWSLTDQFGAGEIAGLIAPRGLVWVGGRFPETQYPNPPGQSHQGAAPGRLGRPDPEVSRAVLEQAGAWLAGVPGVDQWKLVAAQPEELFNDEAIDAFAGRLGAAEAPAAAASKVSALQPLPDNTARQLRQYSQILEDTQWLMREAEFTRGEFWKKADRKNAETFAQSARPYRDLLQRDILGVIPPASLPPSPRTRKLIETNGMTAYEVMLDVHPDVVAYGILVVPRGIRPGEKRPVVVCQHGLEGRPTDVADPRIDAGAYHTYAWRLAERGFVTFAPQNCYIGENRFRQVLRKAQPLKLTLWSFIQRQHEVILDWLASQDFVDPSRMAFYGLSYGGKTAMRIPQVIDRYCLSICSADYNEWIWKNVSARSSYCYLYWGEYDMPEFNLGNTFNYAELSWLMIPRPFMVERGHDDGVAPDEWVAYEFAKTRRQYVKLGLGDRTEIEYFDGPHTIHGKGTFDFLHRHLRWPKP